MSQKSFHQIQKNGAYFVLIAPKVKGRQSFFASTIIQKVKNLVILYLILRYIMKMISEPDNEEFDENFTEPDHDINDEISSKILINDHQKLIIFQVLTIIEN